MSDEYYGTPLAIAITRNSPECVETLLRWGANPNLSTYFEHNGQNALPINVVEHALALNKGNDKIYNNYLAIKQLLLDYGAKPSSTP